MTLVRILALSLLLGAALSGLVWFTWGAVGSLVPKRQPGPAAAEGKGSTKEKDPGVKQSA
jgi:hypothetical protein